MLRGANRPISVSECPWKHHRAVRPMVRGVSALSKHIHWPWKANRRVYHSRAGLWSSIFACQMRCFEVRIGPISVSECPWEHHRAVRPMVRGVSALSKHIYWPWKANRRVYHSRAGFWSSIFACLIARGVHGLFWSWGNPERSNARYNYSPEGTASRSRHPTPLGGQLKCKDDQGTRNLRPQVKIRARAPLPCPSLIRGCAPPP